MRDGGARDDGRAPPRAKVVLGRVEDGDEDADDLLGVLTVGGGGCWGRKGAGDEKGAGEGADAGYNDCKIVAAVPEAVVGGLIAEDLGGGLDCGRREGRVDGEDERA